MRERLLVLLVLLLPTLAACRNKKPEPVPGASIDASGDLELPRINLL